MANPWDQDEIVGGNPWDADEIVAPARKAPAPRQRTSGEQARHKLGTGTRAVLEGVTGAADIVLDPLASGLEHLTGQPMWRGRDYGRMASDALGLGHPETSGERVISDATSATAGVLGLAGAARQIPRAAGPVMQGVKTFFGVQPGMQMTGATLGASAASGVREGGGTQGQQIAAGVAGSVLPGGGGYALAGGTRRALRGNGGDIYTPGELAAMGHQKGGVAESALQQLIAFRRAGINNPTVGQIGQTPFGRTAESALSQFPGSQHIMAQTAQGQIDDATRTINTMTGGAGPTSAGNAIKQGQQDFAGRMRDVDGRIYAPVHAAMDGQQVPIDNTLATLRRATNPVPSTPTVSGEIGNKKLGNVLDSLLADSRRPATFPGIAPPRTIPFEGLKAQRSALGELITESATRDVGAGPKQLSNAYGAMSEDMLAGARGVGPQAESALVRANRVHSQGMQRDSVLRGAVRDKDAPGEDVFRRALAGSSEGGTELATIMKSLKPEQRQEVARAQIREMGWVAKGAQDSMGETFSATTFKNNWANMSDEAKAALFNALSAAERRKLQALADVGQNVQDGSKVFANPAGTAGKSALYSLATSAPAAAVASSSIVPLLLGASAPVAANGLARLATGRPLAGVKTSLPTWITRKTSKPYGIFAPITQTEAQRNRDRTP